MDATTKKTKAPAATASSSVGIANLGAKFGALLSTVCSHYADMTDPFDTSDPFGGTSGTATPSVEASVGKHDKIHIRQCFSLIGIGRP